MQKEHSSLEEDIKWFNERRDRISEMFSVTDDETPDSRIASARAAMSRVYDLVYSGRDCSDLYNHTWTYRQALKDREADHDQ